MNIIGGKEFVYQLTNTKLEGGDFVQKQHRELYDSIAKKTNVKPRITRDDIPGSLQYEEGLTYFENSRKDPTHNGQRKLFLTELQHMNAYLGPGVNALVFYVGSAPSNKAPLYEKYYPGNKYVFVDPNEFNLYTGGFRRSHYLKPRESGVIYMHVSVTNRNYKTGRKSIIYYGDESRIIDKADVDEPMLPGDDHVDFIMNSDYTFYLYEDFMTNELSYDFNRLIKLYKEKYPKNKILFWSDIRSVDDTGIITNTEIVADSARMYNWLSIMKEDVDEMYVMLKARFPYTENEDPDWDSIKDVLDSSRSFGMDFEKTVEDAGTNEVMPWFRGKIYIQAWAAEHSTETRLWCDRKDLDHNVVWDAREHENIMFYYNRIERLNFRFINKYASKEIGFDHCGNCAIEAHIWDEYLDNMKPDIKDREKWIIKQVNNISALTGRSLLRYPHGHLF